MTPSHPSAAGLLRRTAPVAPPAPHHRAALALKALNAVVVAWWCIAVLGPWLFAFYVLSFYGGAAARGEFTAWNRVMPQGWVAGDALGNGVLAGHLLFTVFVVLGGALQGLPWLRRYAPRVHRWNGRIYLLSALVLGLGGLVMVWTRGAVGGVGQHLGTSFNALLIVVFAVLAWRAAMARRFAEHRRWALRLWLAVGGVWFFRIGLMLWLLVHQGPVGFDPDTFRGPFLVFLSFAQALVPLLVLEAIFRAQDNAGPAGRWAMAACLAALAVLTALGTAAAFTMLWWPRL